MDSEAADSKAQELKAGTRLQSQVCTTQIIVVKAPGDAVEITCGGVAMVAPGTENAGGVTAVDGLTDGTGMGKRYVNEDETLEVLCTKPGTGSVGIGTAALALKEAAALPASD